MKKSSSSYGTEAKIFWDKWGIGCVVCPKCEFYIPNVEPGAIVNCPGCQWEFKVTE